jgi:hypothetical protein
MVWTVLEAKKPAKQKNKLPEKVQALMVTLEKEIEVSGPFPGNWPNYSKLGKDLHHCHMKNGNVIKNTFKRNYLLLLYTLNK